MKLVNYLSREIAREALMSNDFKRYYLGPMVVFLFLFFGEVGVRLYGWPVILAIPYAVLSLTVFRWSGLRSALFSALLISLYPPLFRYDWYGFWGSVIIAIGAFLIAGPSVLLKKALRDQAEEAVRQRLETEHALELIRLAEEVAERERRRAEENQAKADAYDNLNGNIDTLRRVSRRISDLTNGWKLLNDAAKMDILEEVQGTIVNLAQKVVGWHEIAEEKKGLLGED